MNLPEEDIQQHKRNRSTLLLQPVFSEAGCQNDYQVLWCYFTAFDPIS
jgi:hypothetical protein